jgi:hypothetical protein
MTHEEIDILWQKAMRQSIEAGEVFTRYHFAKLVAEAEREACAQLCEEWLGPTKDREMHIAKAIRARGEQA